MSVLLNYRPIAQAITLLFPKQIEVIIHDLETGKIIHIENSYSHRQVGDESLIDRVNLKKDLSESDVIGPYTKTNPDGEGLKSISAALRSTDGQLIGLLCINMKTKLFQDHARLLMSLFETHSTDKTQSLLAEDWREKTNTLIAQSLGQLGKKMMQAKRSDKLIIIDSIEQAGIFEIRGSADYVAQAIGISRASLYSFLREVRQDNN